MADGIALAQKLQVSIHTIGFGDLNVSKTSLKLQVLTSLAQETNGVYWHITNNVQEHAEGVQELVLAHSFMGVVEADPALFAYVEQDATIHVDVSADNQVTKHSIDIQIQGTDKFANMLVLVSQKFGGINPWLVIALFIFTIFLFLFVYIWLKYQKRRKTLAQQADLAAQQKIADEKIAVALDTMQEKIDSFNPNDPVSDKGDPYGWLAEGEVRHDLIKYSTLVGRGKSSDVVLKDGHVSAQHAILDFKNGFFVWTDRAPLNSTFINDNKVQGSANLQPGDEIRCGQTTLKFLLK